jgi:hypothetical protein
MDQHGAGVVLEVANAALIDDIWEVGIDTAVSHELLASVIKEAFFGKAAIVAVVMLNGYANTVGMGFERFFGSKHAGAVSRGLWDHEGEAGEVVNKGGQALVAFVCRFPLTWGTSSGIELSKWLSEMHAPWVSCGLEGLPLLHQAQRVALARKQAGRTFGETTVSQLVRNEGIVGHLLLLLASS